jgi:hypothetical protein
VSKQKKRVILKHGAEKPRDRYWTKPSQTDQHAENGGPKIDF